MDREQQRRGEVFACFGFVLVAHDEHCELGGLARLAVKLAFHCVLVGHQLHGAGVTTHGLHQVIALAINRAKAAVLDLEQRVGDVGGPVPIAEIGRQHPQLLPLGQAGVVPEQLLDLCPREIVGVHDLVGVATQQKLPRLLQRPQYQRQLHRRHVLHFIDHHEVVTWLRPRHPVMGDQVQVEQTGFGQPGAVLLEQAIHAVAQLRRKDRLAHAQRRIRGTAERAGWSSRDHPTDFLEGLVGVNLPVGLAHAREPGGKIAPLRLPARGHMDGLHELPVRQENRLLPIRLEAVAVVQVTRALRQIGGVRHVQHLTLRAFEFLQRQCGFAAAGAANNDQRGR